MSKRSFRILIAEHLDLNRTTLKEFLEDEFRSHDRDPNIVEASTLQMALREAQYSRFDAVVTDWMWPPHTDPTAEDKHPHGAQIVDRAMASGVPVRVVVTGRDHARREALENPAVTAAFLWEELSAQGFSGLYDAIVVPASTAIATSGPAPRSVDVVPLPPDSSGLKDPRKVFVVFGHNTNALQSLSDFLNDLDLRAWDFGTARQDTNDHHRIYGGGPVSTYDVVTFATAHAAAVLVLLTGDETVSLANGDFEFRSRPNVIFEAGLAFARQPARTALVHVGRVDSWSDVEGIQYYRFSNKPEDRLALVRFLEGNGLPVDRDKRPDWQTKDYGLV